MFGLLRTILALLVMTGHLLDTWQIGTYAVFGFDHHPAYYCSRQRLRVIIQRQYFLAGNVH